MRFTTWISRLPALAIVLLFPSGASAEPFAYISNAGDDTLSVIDTATNTLIDTINVGDSPQFFGHFISSVPEPTAFLAQSTALMVLGLIVGRRRRS